MIARALTEGMDILPEGDLAELVRLLDTPPGVRDPQPYFDWAKQDGVMRRDLSDDGFNARERALTEKAPEFDRRIAEDVLADAPKYWQGIYLCAYHLDGCYEGFDVGFIREYGGPMDGEKLPKDWTEAGLSFRLPSGVFRKLRHKRYRGSLWSIACVAFERYEAEAGLSWKGLIYG